MADKINAAWFYASLLECYGEYVYAFRL